MGEGVGKKEGYKLRRAGLMNGMLDAGLQDLDALLTKAVDGDKEIEAVLFYCASILLLKLAETSPPPLLWFPKELAMLASSKLLELANMPPERHRGTNSADLASLDCFIIKMLIEGRQDYGILPTKNGYRWRFRLFARCRSSAPWREGRGRCVGEAKAIRSEVGLLSHSNRPIGAPMRF
jgi:hypothetical protein